MRKFTPQKEEQLKDIKARIHAFGIYLEKGIDEVKRSCPKQVDWVLLHKNDTWEQANKISAEEFHDAIKGN